MRALGDSGALAAWREREAAGWQALYAPEPLDLARADLLESSQARSARRERRKRVTEMVGAIGFVALIFETVVVSRRLPISWSESPGQRRDRLENDRFRALREKQRAAVEPLTPWPDEVTEGEEVTDSGRLIREGAFGPPFPLSPDVRSARAFCFPVREAAFEGRRTWLNPLAQLCARRSLNFFMISSAPCSDLRVELTSISRIAESMTPVA
jgi:hypothetical protein